MLTLFKDDTNSLALLNAIYKKELQSLHPQTCAAQRVFTSIPVTVSESEQSFSKLKIVWKPFSLAKGRFTLHS